jgi:mRNA-degrading endonuclease toxin of MazEF toxin-antitoxin module
VGAGDGAARGHAARQVGVVGIGRAAPSAGPSRGDIHLVAFEEIGGHALRGPHPAVVVQSDRMRRSSTVLMCPLTSRGPATSEYEPPYLVRVTRNSSGLDRDGWAKCDQVFTRPVASLGPRLGRLNPETMSAVDAALRFVLELEGASRG